MGSDDDLPNEAPVHKVYLDAYYIGKTEVTNAEYYLFWLESGETDSEYTPISYEGEFGTWPRDSEDKAELPCRRCFMECCYCLCSVAGYAIAH